MLCYLIINYFILKFDENLRERKINLCSSLSKKKKKLPT